MATGGWYQPVGSAKEGGGMDGRVPKVGEEVGRRAGLE